MDSQQAEQPPSESGNTSSYVNALSDSTGALGASLQNMQRVLLGNMQQVALMTQSMNTMMEELVRRAITIGVFAQPSSSSARDHQKGGAYATVLRITVANNSPIPLVGMKAVLRFAQRNDTVVEGLQVTSSPVSVAAAEGRAQTLIEFQPLAATALPPGADDGQPPSSVHQQSDPVNIVSGATGASAVCLSTSVLAQMDGQITVTFTSPGTGTPLSVSHRFGVHLMHLLASQRRFIPPPSSESGLGTYLDLELEGISIDLAYLRRAFAVPPADGIAVGSVLVLVSDAAEAMVLGLRISDIGAGSQYADCNWVVSTQQPEHILTVVLPLLAREISSEIF
ncbi:hypothetical protein EV175_000113 [Coemansia sp. RSA 1933]|nr:hypothetical protein EV175_000113 [Coemansia sp. RSA 1933]